jgi:hypothetical protein
LPITTHTLWKTMLVRFCLGYAVLSVATSARAQTYYSYPNTVATGATSTPVYYYYPTTYQTQSAWNGNTPQYYQVNYTNSAYQATYTPQYYQTSYSQPIYATQTTQATTPGPQYVQTSYVQQTSQPTMASTDATTPAANATAATTTTVSVPAGDPYGFTAWLNATRAAYGLPAVGYDPNLESWAAMNSAQQAASGIGHFVMGPARRQNSAMGGFPGIESMWMASPAHSAALLDPTIRWIGIASYGAYWTFNAY